MRDIPSTFPNPESANAEGIVSFGGPLNTDRLIEAYSAGIFPWPHSGMLLWFSPDPRCILAPSDVSVTKSMERVLKNGKYTISFDEQFRAVIETCSAIPRAGEVGTWITPTIIDAYCALHEQGYAHSVEAWLDDELVGGLYGVSLGRAFFGESMFSHEPNASKACFITLARQLEAWEFDLIDCQMPTDHLLSLGAQVTPRADFLNQLRDTMKHDARRGIWQAGPTGARDVPAA